MTVADPVAELQAMVAVLQSRIVHQEEATAQHIGALRAEIDQLRVGTVPKSEPNRTAIDATLPSSSPDPIPSQTPAQDTDSWSIAAANARCRFVTGKSSKSAVAPAWFTHSDIADNAPTQRNTSRPNPSVPSWLDDGTGAADFVAALTEHKTKQIEEERNWWAAVNQKAAEATSAQQQMEQLQELQAARIATATDAESRGMQQHKHVDKVEYGTPFEQESEDDIDSYQDQCEHENDLDDVYHHQHGQDHRAEQYHADDSRPHDCNDEHLPTGGELCNDAEHLPRRHKGRRRDGRRRDAVRSVRFEKPRWNNSRATPLHEWPRARNYDKPQQKRVPWPQMLRKSTVLHQSHNSSKSRKVKTHVRPVPQQMESASSFRNRFAGVQSMLKAEIAEDRQRWRQQHLRDSRQDLFVLNENEAQNEVTSGVDGDETDVRGVEQQLIELQATLAHDSDNVRTVDGTAQDIVEG